MNSLILLLMESTSLVFFAGLLILLYGLRRAPEGFQHFDLFYYGVPPTQLIPVESTDCRAGTPNSWR